MRRLLVTCFVLLGLIWQATAMAGVMPFLGGEHGEHAALHWQDAKHHHHDDVSGHFHEDDSKASEQHIVLDDALSSPAFWPQPISPAVQFNGVSPLALDESPPPVPFVEGLRRPPRQRL